MRGNCTPSGKLINITKSDTTIYSPELRLIRCGAAGDITLDCRYEDEVTTVLIKNVQVGELIGPMFCIKVRATGTTASDLVGFE